MNKKQKIMLIRILTAAALLAVLHVLPVTGWMRFGLYLIPYLIAGYDILRKALKGIQNRQVFDENFLMAVATVGAIALALYERSGDYTEAIAVMLFYQIGEWFQSYAVGRSRRNISELMDIRPDYANVEDEDGKLEQVDPDDVEVGTVIVVQPGERVPIDGVIVEGTSALNTAALTGESLPRDVQTGDEVISGCVNMTGLLKVRTTKEFGESTVSKILDLVENSSMKKARAENFITRFARVYTPAVCYGALALAFIPPIVLLLILCGMVLWVIAMPGGALLLWHYLGTGVQVGSASFNVVHLILIVSVFYITRAAITASRSFLNRVASQSYKIDKTLIPPMQTGITYGLWTLFALFTLKALGFGLENLAVIAGGLSVGIGFGMQTIVNNFLSGLILIFSRTLHEGDVIDVGNLQGVVRKISVRATTVETFDNAIIFVPNSEFVSNRLINWTRNGRIVRREVAIGVAYGTDPKLVERLLVEVAQSVPQIVRRPQPFVLFMDFADSTLNFVLRYWSDIGTATDAASAIRHRIVEVFAEHQVEIAFPQIDVHVIPQTPSLTRAEG